jgi:NitT/TauT family transport system substrate-binding protein
MHNECTLSIRHATHNHRRLHARRSGEEMSVGSGAIQKQSSSRPGERFVWILALLAVIATLFLDCRCSPAQAAEMRMGVIPALQALPVFVAKDQGLFKKRGVNVELIMFSSAGEKDIALISNNIDGYFGDLLTPLALRGNGRDIVIAATNYDTREDRRMFGLLAKPGSTAATPADLAGKPIAAASNSVVQYVADRLMRSAGVPAEKIQFIEAKNIGLRMQMLLAGQVEAAVLPEPLVSAAIAKGAKLIADDAGLHTSQTVFAFHETFMAQHGAEVRKFFQAVNDAVQLIASDRDLAVKAMGQYMRLPEALANSYPPPAFRNVRAPDKEAVQTIVDWLHKRKVIPTALNYEQVTDIAYVP